MLTLLWKAARATQSPPRRNDRQPNLCIESLEARDVPAVLNLAFVLGDGSSGSAAVTYDETQVNPSLAAQQVAVSAVQLAINGQPVALGAVATAASVSFAQGQLQGTSFGYDLSGDYQSLVVGGSFVAAVASSGQLASGSASVVGTAPPTPTPQPPLGAIPIDAFTALVSFNNKVIELNQLIARLREQMGRIDSLKQIVTDLNNRITNTINPALAQTLTELVQIFYDEYLSVSMSLAADYTAYSALFFEVARQEQILFGGPDRTGGLLGPGNGLIAPPVPEPLTIPDLYFPPPGLSGSV